MIKLRAEKRYNAGKQYNNCHIPTSSSRLRRDAPLCALFYFRRTAGRRKKPDKIQDDQPQEPGKTKQENRPPENIGGLENSDIFDKNDLAGPGAAVRATGARVPADLGRRIPIASGTDLAGLNIHQLSRDLDLVPVDQETDDPLKLPVAHQKMVVGNLGQIERDGFPPLRPTKPAVLRERQGARPVRLFRKVLSPDKTEVERKDFVEIINGECPVIKLVDEHGADLVVIQRFKLVDIAVGLEGNGCRCKQRRLDGVSKDFRRDIADTLIVVAAEKRNDEQPQEAPEKVLSDQGRDFHDGIISRHPKKMNSK